MVKGHRYAIFLNVYRIADAPASGFTSRGTVSATGASAASSMNFATVGNGLVLAAVGES